MAWTVNFPKHLIKKEITIMYKMYCRVEKKDGKWEGEKKGKEEGRGGSERERKRVNLFYEAHIALH